MKIMMRQWMAALGAAALLAGCGGGGGGDGGSGSGTQPTAAISAASGGSAVSTGGNVRAGVALELDGSGSREAQSYAWKLEKAPEGSAAVIDAPAAAKSSLTPDLPGDYQVSLTVLNGTRSSSAVLSVVAINDQPIARVANGDISARIGMVQLDGSSSLPPWGGLAAALTYQWTLKEVPTGSALLALPAGESAQPRPRFEADVEGVYLVELRVGYNGLVSAPVVVKVTVSKPYSAPVASIGTLPATALRGSAIALDGSGSSLGSGGTSMQYRWTISSIDPGPQAVLPETQNLDKAMASFTPRAVGRYTVKLTVFDGIATASSTTTISVAKPDGDRNTAPVVVLKPSVNATVWTEAEKGASIYVAQSGIYDIDEANLTGGYYEYAFTKYPAGFDPSPYLPTTAGAYRGDFTFKSIVTGNEVDEYTLQVRVRDAEGDWSAPGSITFMVRNGANRVPIARAETLTGSNTALVGATVGLTGENSSDLDKNRLTYAWTIVDRPDGSAAQLQGANAVDASFVADKAGLYTVSLTVTDSHGAVSKGPSVLTIQAKTQNNKPVARPFIVGAVADRDQPLVISEFDAGAETEALYARLKTHLFNGLHFVADAYDPDGDVLTYSWTLVSEPANTVSAYPAQIFNSGYQDVAVANNALGFTAHPFGTGSVANFDIFPCVVGGIWQVYGATEPVADWVSRNLSARSWTCERASVAPREVGDYRVELKLFDGMDFDGPYPFEFRTVKRANYPTLLLEDTQQGDPVFRRYSTDYNGSDRSASLLNGRLAQRFFPFSLRATSYQNSSVYPTSGIWAIPATALAEGDNVYQTYQLTAFDRDYTIADLAVTSTNPLFQVRIDGLRDAQVIRRGETVVFKLVFTAPAQASLPAGTAFYEAGEGIEWSFRIAEREGWNFSVKPRFELTAE